MTEEQTEASNVIDAQETFDALVASAGEDFLKKLTGAVRAAQPQKSRRQERDEQRKANAQIAREAAARRAARKTANLVERVDKAKHRLAGVNVEGAIMLLNQQPSAELDVYLLAEKYGQARKGVLQQFGNSLRGSVERQYLAEAGLGSPEHGHKGLEE